MIAGTCCAEGVPAVAFDGTGYVLAWSHVQAPAADGLRTWIDETRISPAGALVATSSSHVTRALLDDGAHGLEGVALACTPDACLVVWDDHETSYAVRIASDDRLLDPVPRVVGAGTCPAVATDGADFLIAAGGTLFRMDAAGTLLDPEGIVPGGGCAEIAFGGGVYLVNHAGLAMRVSAAGTVSYPLEFSSGVFWGEAAWNGSVFLLRQESHLRRVAPDGTILDPTFIEMPEDGAGSSLASDGTSFLCPWIDTAGGVHARRLSGEGLFLETSPLTLSVAPAATDAYGQLGMASDGVTYLLATQSSGHTPRAMAWRTLVDGAHVDAAATALDRGTNDQRGPFVLAGWIPGPPA